MCATYNGSGVLRYTKATRAIEPLTAAGADLKNNVEASTGIRLIYGSYNGIITYDPSTKLATARPVTGSCREMVETDGNYLFAYFNTPSGHRLNLYDTLADTFAEIFVAPLNGWWGYNEDDRFKLGEDWIFRTGLSYAGLVHYDASTKTANNAYTTGTS